MIETFELNPLYGNKVSLSTVNVICRQLALMLYLTY